MAGGKRGEGVRKSEGLEKGQSKRQWDEEGEDEGYSTALCIVDHKPGWLAL